MIELVHNFEPSRFMWLWAKYVTGFNKSHHCTNAIPGQYSKKFSKNNVRMSSNVQFDERPSETYDVIYICGVAKEGYTRKQNYAHNVHAAIFPEAGARDEWSFEHWRMTVDSGRFLSIPRDVRDIPEEYRAFPDKYTSCRIFRWAASWYGGRHG